MISRKTCKHGRRLMISSSRLPTRRSSADDASCCSPQQTGGCLYSDRVPCSQVTLQGTVEVVYIIVSVSRLAQLTCLIDLPLEDVSEGRTYIHDVQWRGTERPEKAR